MSSISLELKKTEKKKLVTATKMPEDVVQQEERTAEARGRSRGLRKNQKTTLSTESATATQNEGTQDGLKDTSPINLTDRALTDAQNSLLATGPSFCPIPKDIIWLKARFFFQQDLDSFDRRVRTAAYFANRGQERDVPVVSQLPEVPKVSGFHPSFTGS